MRTVNTRKWMQLYRSFPVSSVSPPPPLLPSPLSSSCSSSFSTSSSFSSPSYSPPSFYFLFLLLLILFFLPPPPLLLLFLFLMQFYLCVRFQTISAKSFYINDVILKIISFLYKSMENYYIGMHFSWGMKDNNL